MFHTLLILPLPQSNKFISNIVWIITLCACLNNVLFFKTHCSIRHKLQLEEIKVIVIIIIILCIVFYRIIYIIKYI